MQAVIYGGTNAAMAFPLRGAAVRLFFPPECWGHTVLNLKKHGTIK